MMNQQKTLLDWESEYKNDEDYHRNTVETFKAMVNEIPWLKEHRDFVEKYVYGFGERSFHWMWRLLVNEMSSGFRFLEIGVYKGQVISLVRMLASRAGKLYPQITGVTPLSTFSGNHTELKFPDENYMEKIKELHAKFNIPFSEDQIVIGDSTLPDVQARVLPRGPFDIVYVDGCHEYDFVVKDLDVYGAMVKKGGYLVVDDSSNFLKMYWGSFPGIEDVSRAVQDRIVGNPQWKEVFVVMHNRIFRRV